MKLRELYRQKTNFSLISKINNTVKAIGIRLPGFGLRRLSPGVLTVFWMLVWGGILFAGTYVATTVFNIQTSMVYESWVLLMSDLYAILSSPLGIPTIIAGIYGFSIYLENRSGKAFEQSYSDRSFKLKRIVGSIVLTTIGLSVFTLTSFQTIGFYVGLAGAIATTRYMKIISLHDRKSTHNHYDIYKTNGITRSLTIWSIVHAIVGTISYITMIPLAVLTLYTTQYTIRRTYSETLMDVYDKGNFIKRLEDNPTFFRYVYGILDHDFSDDTTESTSLSSDQTVSGYKNMRQTNTKSHTNLGAESTTDAGLKNEDIDKEDVLLEEQKVEPASDISFKTLNDLHNAMVELESQSASFEMEDGKSFADIDFRNIYTKEEPYLVKLHKSLEEISENINSNSQTYDAVDRALNRSTKVVEEISDSRKPQ